MVLGPVKLTSLAVNVAVNPLSHSWPMDIRLRLPKSGKTLERRAPIGNWGKGRRAVCVSPSFLLNGQTFTGFVVVYKKAGLVYKLEGNAEDMF